jgi:hypothetical protein
MDDALSIVHCSEVNLLVVVTSVGPTKEDPYGTREICVKDTRLVLLQLISNQINNANNNKSFLVASDLSIFSQTTTR